MVVLLRDARHNDNTRATITATHAAMNDAHSVTMMPLSALYVPDDDDTPSSFRSAHYVYSADARCSCDDGYDTLL
jgi:hypothetical protein